MNINKLNHNDNIFFSFKAGGKKFVRHPLIFNCDCRLTICHITVCRLIVGRTKIRATGSKASGMLSGSLSYEPFVWTGIIKDTNTHVYNAGIRMHFIKLNTLCRLQVMQQKSEIMYDELTTELCPVSVASSSFLFFPSYVSKYISIKQDFFIWLIFH